MALRTHEASLLTVVRAAMQMLPDTLGQGKPALHRRRVNEAVKVNPLATIH